MDFPTPFWTSYLACQSLTVWHDHGIIEDQSTIIIKLYCDNSAKVPFTYHISLATIRKHNLVTMATVYTVQVVQVTESKSGREQVFNFFLLSGILSQNCFVTFIWGHHYWVTKSSRNANIVILMPVLALGTIQLVSLSFLFISREQTCTIIECLHKRMLPVINNHNK